MIFEIPKSLRPLVGKVSLYDLSAGGEPVLDGKSMAVLHLFVEGSCREENWVVVLELDTDPPQE